MCSQILYTADGTARDVTFDEAKHLFQQLEKKKRASMLDGMGPPPAGSCARGAAAN